MTINIIASLAELAGATREEIIERGSKGAITFDQISEAFNHAIAAESDSILKPAVADRYGREGESVLLEGHGDRVEYVATPSRPSWIPGVGGVIR